MDMWLQAQYGRDVHEYSHFLIFNGQAFSIS